MKFLQMTVRTTTEKFFSATVPQTGKDPGPVTISNRFILSRVSGESQRAWQKE